MVAEYQVMLPVETTQNGFYFFQVVGKGNVAKVVNGVFGLHGFVPAGNHVFVQLFQRRRGGAKLWAKFSDVFVREMKVGCEIDLGHAVSF